MKPDTTKEKIRVSILVERPSSGKEYAHSLFVDELPKWDIMQTIFSGLYGRVEEDWRNSHD